MDVSSATAIIAATQAQTRQGAQMAMMKQAHAMETQLVDMLAEAAAPAAAPAGTGSRVDRIA